MPDRERSKPDPSLRDQPTIDTPVASAADRRAVAPPPALARIGPYAITGVLGSGGFGTVYLAEQAKPHRKVAIKVVRGDTIDVLGAQAQARFLHEADLLARLEHPAIAHVFEAGFYDPRTGESVRDPDPTRQDLRPFFAMEYVQGVPLTDYVRDAHSSPRERLDLFRRICDGVHHAHLNGVVHRDLKPANILVDSSGRPKILDFGVARAIDDEVRRATIETDVVQIVGTLPYMSPEQVAGVARAVDGRSDVYALGVILYELLTGALPYDLDKKLLHEATRIICETPARRPSESDRALRGDLDLIVLKALEKEKSRRYQSAADLSEDVRRFMDDEPIVARPPSRIYELRKFATRHRGLVAGVATAFVALAVGASVATYQALRAARAEEEEQERRTEAEAAIEFLANALEAADAEKQGRDVRLADMLDGAVAEIDASLAEKPGVAGVLRRSVARAYRGLGLYDESLVQADAAVEALEGASKPDDPGLLDARETRALVNFELARFEPALSELEVVHAIRAVKGETSASIETLSNLAMVHAMSGQLDEGERIARQALAESQRLSGAEGEQTDSLAFQLAQVLAEATKTEEAEAIYTGVLDWRRKRFPEGHAMLQSVRESLGALYRQQAKYDEAAEIHAEMLGAFRSKYGDDHPRTLSKAVDLGKALQQAGRLDEAEPILRAALEASVRIQGPEHFDTLTASAFLADTLQARGDLSGAAALRRTVAEVRAKLLGADHPQTLVAWTNLSLILIDEAKYDEAREVVIDLLARRERLLGPEHNEVALTLGILGLLELRREDGAAAEQWYRRSMAIREKVLAEGDGILGITMTGLGHALALQGKYAEAEPLLTVGAEWALADPRPAPRTKIEAAERVAKLYEAWGKPEQAEAWRERAEANR